MVSHGSSKVQAVDDVMENARAYPNRSDLLVSQDRKHFSRSDNSVDASGFQVSSLLEADHHAKWWYSTVHIVTAMVGAGVLTLPSTMVYLGWGPGMMMLAVSWLITLATMHQMIEMHEDDSGRYDTYQALGQLAFGMKRGLYIVGAQQIVVQVSTNIVYLVTGGHALRKFYDLTLDKIDYGVKEPGWIWISIFASLQALLSIFASFSAMTMVSVVACIMSVGYSTIAWGTSIGFKQSHTSYKYPCNFTYYRAFNALGEIAFAYGGHNVTLEIQATMRSTQQKPSKLPMWNGVLVAYVIVALCYFPVAGVGYWALGNMTCYDNVLEVLEKPKWLLASANMMLMLHLTGSYQVFALPIYDGLVNSLRTTPVRRLGIWVKPLYVVFTCFVAVMIPSFSGLLGLFGGLALAPTTYFLPCIMWLLIKKPRTLGLEWILNWGCIVFGVALMMVSFVGSLVNLINGFKDNKYDVFMFPALQRCSHLPSTCST